MKGRIIIIEGTDCSGKETQSELLKIYLEKLGRNVFSFYFPHYESPTGKIIGGPFLGKSSICEGWFPETAPNVDPKVASLYYAADRYYHLPIILEKLAKGIDCIIDRFTYSNMAHQAGKLKTKEERKAMFHWLEKLEFEMLGLPKPDIRLFLHMPFEAGKILRENRTEELDENERNDDYLKISEQAYLEIAELFDFKTIECSNHNIKSITDIKTPEKIHEEIVEYLMNLENM